MDRMKIFMESISQLGLTPTQVEAVCSFVDTSVPSKPELIDGPCPVCDGQGWYQDDNDGYTEMQEFDCGNCWMTGTVKVPKPTPTSETCPICGGRGKVPISKNTYYCHDCENCNGTGIIDTANSN